MPDTLAPTVFPKEQARKFALAGALVSLAFAVPLWRLFWFAISDELHSYIPLIPFVSGYLVWTQKSQLPASSPPARGLAALFGIFGFVAAAGYVWSSHVAWPAGVEDRLALAMGAWLLCWTGAGCWFLGGAMMRALAFPFCLLIFMIPFPGFLREGIETVLQHGSAAAADGMFVLAGMPFARDGLVFQLPGITLRVAPECSGIHSTLILFITSLIAGQLLLRRSWRRTALCLAVIPLALLRNGFRVFVIGELCVHVSPRMIDSPIHHHGGPLFFVLSLVPFFLLILLLKKTEPAGDGPSPEPKNEK